MPGEFGKALLELRVLTNELVLARQKAGGRKDITDSGNGVYRGKNVREQDTLRECKYLPMPGAQQESEGLTETESEEEGRSHTAKGLYTM